MSAGETKRILVTGARKPVGASTINALLEASGRDSDDMMVFAGVRHAKPDDSFDGSIVFTLDYNRPESMDLKDFDAIMFYPKPDSERSCKELFHLLAAYSLRPGGKFFLVVMSITDTKPFRRTFDAFQRILDLSDIPYAILNHAVLYQSIPDLINLDDGRPSLYFAHPNKVQFVDAEDVGRVAADLLLDSAAGKTIALAHSKRCSGADVLDVANKFLQQKLILADNTAPFRQELSGPTKRQTRLRDLLFSYSAAHDVGLIGDPHTSKRLQSLHSYFDAYKASIDHHISNLLAVDSDTKDKSDVHDGRYDKDGVGKYNKTRRDSAQDIFEDKVSGKSLSKYDTDPSVGRRNSGDVTSETFKLVRSLLALLMAAVQDQNRLSDRFDEASNKLKDRYDALVRENSSRRNLPDEKSFATYGKEQYGDSIDFDDVRQKRTTDVVEEEDESEHVTDSMEDQERPRDDRRQRAQPDLSLRGHTMNTRRGQDRARMEHQNDTEYSANYTDERRKMRTRTDQTRRAKTSGSGMKYARRGKREALYRSEESDDAAGNVFDGPTDVEGKSTPPKGSAFVREFGRIGLGKKTRLGKELSSRRNRPAVREPMTKRLNRGYTNLTSRIFPKSVSRTPAHVDARRPSPRTDRASRRRSLVSDIRDSDRHRSWASDRIDSGRRSQDDEGYGGETGDDSHDARPGPRYDDALDPDSEVIVLSARRSTRTSSLRRPHLDSDDAARAASDREARTSRVDRRLSGQTVGRDYNPRASSDGNGEVGYRDRPVRVSLSDARPGLVQRSRRVTKGAPRRFDAKMADRSPDPMENRFAVIDVARGTVISTFS